jgi:Domain of unknown function (DUF4132)
MKFLSRLLGSLSSSHDPTVGDDLKRLNFVKAGLGDQAIAYVRTGVGETVLGSLNALCKANELEVGKRWVDQKSPTLKRREMLARAHPYDVAQVQRYVEVLCAASAPMPAATGPARYAAASEVGTEKAPRPFRVLMTEACLGLQARASPPQSQALETGLTLDAALDMVKRLGGDLVDFFDVLYVKDSPYSVGGEYYRRAVSIRPVMEAHPPEVIAAGNRAPAVARAELIGDLLRWKLVRGSAFTAFLVAQAGDSAKGVREAAANALAHAPVEATIALAVEQLKRGDADQRTGMVTVLAQTRAEAALEALRAHRETEKTARIAAAIDTVLSLGERREQAGPDEGGATGYVAIDGRRIDVPPLKPLADGPAPTFGDADRVTIHDFIDKQNEQIKRRNEESQKRGYAYRAPVIPNGWVDRAIALLSGGEAPSASVRNDVTHFLNWGPCAAWTRSAVQRMPERLALRIAARLTGGARQAAFGHAGGPGRERLQAFLNGPDGDLRHLEAIDIKAGAQFDHGDWRNRQMRPMRKGDLLRSGIQGARTYYHPSLERLPRNALWPYLAENLDVFDEAFGLKPQGDVKLDCIAAVRALALLPAPPARYFAPLLEVATSEIKLGRAEARAMLNAAPEVEARLVALLDDSRQTMRAGAAEWLSVRRDPSALTALYRRLKKEKSEVARAAILTALKHLGEDLSDILGPAALIDEAEKGLKTAKFDKLSWLPLAHLPRLRFCDGASVPPDVPKWWTLLAFKLKQPGGNALFQIYLDQLDPTDAETFSTWVLESWLAYDTARPSEADAVAYARAGAQARAQVYQRWQKDYTEAMAFASLKAEFMGRYLNSGADSKGVLALATRARSAVAAERVRAYLKAHGARTSQASALLEMLAGIGDAVALQVVIAAATRLKQKGVQKFAGELVTKIAEAREWTLDELADRTVPTGGFDEDGVLALPCGEDGKVYEARLDASLNIVLRNPAGKEVAGLPSGSDEATSASKKLLATAKKEVKQIVAMQSVRLYEALCAERSWTAEDWPRSFREHPVMRRLVERVVWLGLDAEGNIAGMFRPTAEGDFTDAQDEGVDVSAFACIRLAHSALLSEAQRKAWEQHLADYEVKPLFTQFSRSLLRPSCGRGAEDLHRRPQGLAHRRLHHSRRRRKARLRAGPSTRRRILQRVPEIVPECGARGGDRVHRQ